MITKKQFEMAAARRVVALVKSGLSLTAARNKVSAEVGIGYNKIVFLTRGIKRCEVNSETTELTDNIAFMLSNGNIVHSENLYKALAVDPTLTVSMSWNKTDLVQCKSAVRQILRKYPELPPYEEGCFGSLDVDSVVSELTE